MDKEVEHSGNACVSPALWYAWSVTQSAAHPILAFFILKFGRMLRPVLEPLFSFFVPKDELSSLSVADLFSINPDAMVGTIRSIGEYSSLPDSLWDPAAFLLANLSGNPPWYTFRTRFISWTRRTGTPARVSFHFAESPEKSASRVLPLQPDKDVLF